MLYLTYRNLLLFFRDKTTVLLSFLSEFIIILLYICFMRNNLIESFPTMKDSELLLDIWLMAGVLGTASVSASMNVYTIMVEDKVNKLCKDFASTPIHPLSMPFSYLIAASIVSGCISFLLFLLGEFYFFIQYHVYPGAERIFLIYGLIILSSVSGAVITFLPVSFLKSSSSLTSVCTISGSLIGFLTGIYLPLGNLSDTIRWFIVLFPVSHSVVLFRKHLMEPFLTDSFFSLTEKPACDFMEYMGIGYFHKENILPDQFSILYLLLSSLTAIVFVLCCRKRT